MQGNVRGKDPEGRAGMDSSACLKDFSVWPGNRKSSKLKVIIGL